MTREFFNKVLHMNGKAYVTKKYEYRAFHHNGLVKIARFDLNGKFKSIVAVY